ncbi:MAG: hypothetical protein ACERKN_13710 [Velocimicrobium sp.]
MDKLNEYKEIYYKELEFKDSMNGKTGNSITFLTILCTGHVYMFNIVVRLDFVFCILPILFTIFEGISVFYTALSILNFYRSYHNYEYKYISIEDTYIRINENEKLKNYYSDIEINSANCNMLSDSFIKNAINNREENMRKSENQMKLSSSIIKAIVSLISTYVFWIFFINRIFY